MHKNRKKRFIEVLRIELEDLHDDIDALMEHCNDLLKKHEISEIGYWGNLSVLKNELRGVGFFDQILTSIDPSEYDSLEAMVEELENRLLAEIKKYGMVPAVARLVRRKIDKVTKFLED